MHDFSDHVVLVTGATGNLGTAVAQAFAASGANLALTDHGKDRLASAFADLDAKDHLYLDGVDVTDETAVAHMAQQVIERFGKIDVLVNTVGGFASGTPVHETDLATWEKMVSLNGRSVFLVCRAVIPAMLAQKNGRIINIAARPALKGNAKMAAYSVGKTAVLRLTESMSAELKQKGINVNCILPGTIDTPQNRQAMPDADTDKWVKPESLADVILFLASVAARDIHGAALPVTGRS